MPRHTGWAVRIVISVLVCLAGPVMACQVPVFRYALENWEPEPYLLIVAHRGSFSATDKALVEQLEKTLHQHGDALNLDVKVVDLSTTKEPVLEKVLGAKTKLIQAPQMLLIYPFDALPPPPAGSPYGTPTLPAVRPGLTAALPGRTPAPPALSTCPDGKCGARCGDPRLAWSGDLSAEHIGQLATSPARKQIADRLLSGQSAVWVLLECGDPAKDAAATTKLEQALAQMQRTLKLPDKKTIEADDSFRPDTKVDLRIEFSVIRIPQQRAGETIFASTLLNSDPAVSGKQEPIALAIFGRGRSYYAVAGSDINADTVEEHGRFLTGDCSCEVKEQNPGVDLLFAVPWQKSITRISGREHDSPELMGIGVFGTAEAISLRPAETARSDDTKIVASSEQAMSARAESPTTSPHATPTTAASATETPSGRVPLTWILGSAAIGLGVVLLGTIWLRMGR